MKVAPSFKDIGKRMRGIPMLVGPRRPVPRDGRVRRLPAGACRCRRRRSRCSPAGNDAIDLARAANDGMAELVRRHPGSLSRVRGLAAARRSRRRAARARTRARRPRRPRHSDLLEHSRQADRRARVPAAVRSAWRVRPADLDASVPRRGHPPTTRPKTASEFEIWWTFGWPYETSAAMARLVFAGHFDRFPN